MHELSIAMSIVEMAEEEAELRAVTIDAVHLELGLLSGVAPDPLRFAYDLASSGTRLEGTRLVIKQVPIEVFCQACDSLKILRSMQRLCCPDCGAPISEIIHGTELTITALEVRSKFQAASGWR